MSTKQATTSDDTEVYGRAVTPDWTVTVHDYQDPYSGQVTNPEDPPAGTRYIGADIEIANASDQGLTFVRDRVRLRDADGFEFKAGSTSGDAPAIEGRTLGQDERSRGWVWFTVSSESRITELLLIPSAPEFRVPIQEN